MECPFVPNQKLRCIGEFRSISVRGTPRPPNYPRLGRVYVARDFIVMPDNKIGVELFEVPGFFWDHMGFEPFYDPLAEFLATRTRKKPRQKTKESV